MRMLVRIVLLAMLVCWAPRAPASLNLVDPVPGGPTLAPTVDVDVVLSPSLGAGEVLVTTLFADVDSPASGVTAVDLTGATVFAAGGAMAQVLGVPLSPGRSTLQVQRIHSGAGTVVESAALTLDREGFSGTGPHPFAAGLLQAQVTRPATTNPAAVRTLDLLVWYPTDDFATPPHPVFDGGEGTPLAAGAVALPVVLFSHGNCGIHYQSTFLTAELARAGFVVVAMSHEGNTFLDPGCNDVATLVTTFLERPEDVSATLDWLLARNLDPASLLFGAVDPSRVGLTGHSFGGQTTFRTAGVDPRFAAAMPLAPEYAFTAGAYTTILPLSVPTFVQGATLDGTTPFVDHQVGLYDRLVSPRWLLEVLGEGHLAFANPASPATHAVVNQYSLGFLGTYARGDRRWDSLLFTTPAAILTEDAPALPSPTVCANGLDDDADGSVDGDDPGCTGPADGSEAASRNVPGRRLLLRDRDGQPERRRLVWNVTDPGVVVAAPGGAGDPTLGGAAFQVHNPVSGESMRLTLAADGWRTTRSGYRFRPGPEDPDCRIVVRPGRLQGSCRGAEITYGLDEPSQGSIAAGLSLGSQDPHCSLFGGQVLRDAGATDGRSGRFLAVASPAPADCPLP